MSIAAEPAESGASAPWSTSGKVRDLLGSKPVQLGAVVLGFLGTVASGVCALEAGRIDETNNHDWWFGLPTSWLTPPHGLPNTIFLYGLGALVLAWLVLGIGVHLGRWSIRRLWAVGGAWALPWLLAPVALSADVYIYLGQGLVLRGGLDPYTSGPGAVELPTPLNERIPDLWLNQPSPYGPGFTGIDSLVAPLARHDLTLAIILLRLVVLAGLALAAVCLPRVARAAGADPAFATWLGVCSPLALGSVVLSGHNDGLMVGFVVAALALFTRTEWRWSAPAAVAVATCAMAIKLPAALAVGAIGIAWAWRASNIRIGLGRLVTAVAIMLGVTAVISAITTLGTRWMNLTAINSPSSAGPQFTPSRAVVNAIVALGADPADVPLIFSRVITAAVVIAAVLAILLLARMPRIGVVKTTAILLTVTVLATAVLWPWYLSWPILLLGACVRGKARIMLVVIAAGALFLTSPNGGPYDLTPTGYVIEAVLVAAMLIATGFWIVRNLFGPRAQSPTHEVR